jgi:hypothetical protein
MKRLVENETASKGLVLIIFSCHLTMNFCDFCGKGPFPARSGLNKHIRNSVNCNNAESKKRGRYTTNMWDNAPGSSSANIRLQQVASSLPPILEDDELANMETFTLDEDVHGPEEDVANARGAPPETPRPGPEMMADHPEEEEESKSTYYIEEFPQNLGAGAVWGEEIPFFEKLRLKQEEDGSSRWGPFEDQDEWELAQWLIRNVGQKQLDGFLNLNIVSTHRLVNFDTESSLDI